MRGGLAGLDRRYVPALARALRRPLVQRRPFRLLAELPQLGFVAIGLLLCVALAVVGQRLGDRPDAAASAANPGGLPAGAAPTGGGSPAVGPTPGTDLAAYLPGRQQELLARAGDGPDDAATAVVSLAAYARPGELAGLLGEGVTLRGVFVHVAVQEAGVVTPTPAGLLSLDPGASPADGLARLAEDLERQATDNQRQADSITQIFNPATQEQKDLFLREARVQRLEARTLREGGPCLYGAVLTATAGRLAALSVRPGVRLVDPAPEGLDPGRVRARALLPEDRDTVSAPETLPGLGAP